MGGSPPLQSGGQNQKWPTSGQGGYITPAAWGVPTASERGTESGAAHKWARWLHNPCRMGGSPPLQSAGHNQRSPTSGRGGYRTPAAWGVLTASERGTKSGAAHKWARWPHNPCRLGGRHRFRARGRIRGGPQVGKVATYPLPIWGVLPASERGTESGAAHKWARWLHNPCRLGGPHRFRAGGRIRGGPQVGKVAK